MKQQRRSVWVWGVLLGLLTGCSSQAAYMRGWQPVEGMAQRWSGGTLRQERLSKDEATVYQELGTPAVIRFYRTIRRREPVYAWIYTNPERVIWFVNGRRVEYVAVDSDTSGWTRAQREAVQSKLTQGGVLATLVGGTAAGVLILSGSLEK